MLLCFYHGHSYCKKHHKPKIICNHHVERKQVTEEPLILTHLFSFKRIMTKLLFVFSAATIAQPTDSPLLPLSVFALVFATEQPNPPLAYNYCPLRDPDLFLWPTFIFMYSILRGFFLSPRHSSLFFQSLSLRVSVSFSSLPPICCAGTLIVE